MTLHESWRVNVKYTKHKLLLAATLAAASLFAQPVAAELKIGFVDLAKLSENAPQVIAAQEKIDAEFSSRVKEIDALQRKLAKMEEELGKDGEVMSASERSKKERDILSMRRDLKRTQEEFRDDLNIRKNEMLRTMNVEIGTVIDAYAKEQQFDLILAQGVMFAGPKVDITDQILKQLGDR
jgi:outer membrane protein